MCWTLLHVKTFPKFTSIYSQDKTAAYWESPEIPNNVGESIFYLNIFLTQPQTLSYIDQ